MIHEVFCPTKADTMEAHRRFLDHQDAKYPEACECLPTGEEVLFTFHDSSESPDTSGVSPYRSTNPMESTFRAAGYHARQAKDCRSRVATLKRCSNWPCKPRIPGGDPRPSPYGPSARRTCGSSEDRQSGGHRLSTVMTRVKIVVYLLGFDKGYSSTCCSWRFPGALQSRDSENGFNKR